MRKTEQDRDWRRRQQETLVEDQEPETGRSQEEETEKD